MESDELSRVDSTFLSDEIAIDLWQIPLKAGKGCFAAVSWEPKVGRFCYQSSVVGLRQRQAVIIDLMATSELSSSGHRGLWQSSGAENWHGKEKALLLKGATSYMTCRKHIDQNVPHAKNFKLRCNCIHEIELRLAKVCSRLSLGVMTLHYFNNEHPIVRFWPSSFQQYQMRWPFPNCSECSTREVAVWILSREGDAW